MRLVVAGFVVLALASGCSDGADEVGTAGPGAAPSSTSCAQQARDEEARARRDGAGPSDAARRADEMRAACEAGRAPVTPSSEPAQCRDAGGVARRRGEAVQATEGFVYVFLTCQRISTEDGFPVYGFERPSEGIEGDAQLLEHAVALYLAGPLANESQAGFGSALAGVAPPVAASVSLEGGVARIDFVAGLESRSLATGSASTSVLAELTSTVFQFPVVTSLELSENGSCESFWLRMDSTDCREISREDDGRQPS